MIFLLKDSPFPDVTQADGDGLLAIGKDLSAASLLEAYNQGIFPWYQEGEPILWWNPDPRMVLFLHEFKVSKSLKQTLRKNTFKTTFNQSFERVIDYCSKTIRKGQKGTWISKEMKEAYVQLHHLGHAVSVEAWQENKLVGGLYGIDLPDKKVFCGESMFHHTTDASKVAFYALVESLKQKNYRLVDCQVYTSHLESLGAREIDRSMFLEYLK